jgi:hypothetical protein
MTENSVYEYLPGTCYTCQKCLRCFKLPQENPCNCQKDKTSRVKNPPAGQQIYQRAFTPSQLFPKLNQFLFSANTKFGYNSNFEECFSYTTCSACNSKLQRLKDSDKKSQPKKTQKLSRNKKTDEVIVKNNKKRDDKNNYDGYVSNEEDDNDDDDGNDDGNNDGNNDGGNDDSNDDGDRDRDEDDDIDEVKIQLVVMNNNIKTPTAKILTIQPASYKNVMEKINLATRKILGKSMDNYTISYKAVNARGPSNTLEDKLDFQEFISEYQKITSSGKRMLVTATVKSNVTEKKNRKNKKVKFFDIFVR